MTDIYEDWVCPAIKFFFFVLAVVIAAITLFPAIAFAESSEAMPDISSFWTAMGDKHWPLAVGIGLTIVVWLARSFVLKKLPKKVLPWATLVLAVIGTTGARMVQAINSGLAWWQGLIQGVLEGASVGLAAMGFWDVKQSIKKRD